MAIKLKTVNCTKRYNIAFEDKCEKCGNIFSWNKTIDIIRSSDIESFAKAKVELTNYQLRDYVFTGCDECDRKIFSHPITCPNCKHKQEWIEKAIDLHKKSDTLGKKSMRFLPIAYIIAFVFIYKQSQSFLLSFIIPFLPLIFIFGYLPSFIYSFNIDELTSYRGDRSYPKLFKLDGINRLELKDNLF